MRENDGRKLDHATLETLRIRAVQAVEAGGHPEDVARAIGMARGRRACGWPSTARVVWRR